MITFNATIAGMNNGYFGIGFGEIMVRSDVFAFASFQVKFYRFIFMIPALVNWNLDMYVLIRAIIFILLLEVYIFNLLQHK